MTDLDPKKLHKVNLKKKKICIFATHDENYIAILS